MPADVVIIAPSVDKGNYFIQTSSLDGQKYLKTRNILKGLQLQRFMTSGSIECKLPNAELYESNGTLRLSDDELYPLSENQLSMKGSKLMN